jgi:predicted DCC family thiol-disulfide oxidoreductase YuxK
MNNATLTLYYDGLCPLCSREIAHYRKKMADDPSVEFLDITEASFDARQHGLDPEHIHRVMHVRAGGEVRTGLDAFIAIWQHIPAYRWLAWLARLPGLYRLLWLAYHAFARVRPLLPRRKARCAGGTCRMDE